MGDVPTLPPAEELAMLRGEVASLRARLSRLETLAAEHRAAEAKLAWLATLPEQNPNLVIETDGTGSVTYLNPVAQALFPELWTDGVTHPLLRDLRAIAAGFESGAHPYLAREIELDDAVYEQKICHARHGDLVRIRVYASDITRRTRAERSIQRLAKRVVVAQEEERRRIARELHDEAGQALTALKLGLSLIRNELPEAETIRRNLGDAIALADETKERIRLLAHGLRPPALETVGLNLTLEALCREFGKRTQLTIRYEGVELEGLPDTVNICLYRVLQEALTNVATHAGATRVDVNLACDADDLRLVIADDGRGLTTRTARLGLGIGLLGMQERLEMLGGRLRIDSEPGQGTRLVAHVPREAPA